MLKLLVPVEESDVRQEMIGSLILWLNRLETPFHIDLINVQPALHGDVGLFVRHNEIEGFQREEGLKALNGTMKQLQQEGIPCDHHIFVGDAAVVIADFSRQNDIHQIVIGYRPAGTLETLLGGSLTSKVMQLTNIPVMLIK